MQPRSFYRYAWIMAGIAILYIIIILMVRDNTAWTVCPSRLIFGLPCPGCGLSRAVDLLWQGELRESLMMNANILIAVPFGIAGLFMLLIDLASNKSTFHSFYKWIESKCHGWMLTVFIICELIIMARSIIRDGVGWPWLQ